MSEFGYTNNDSDYARVIAWRDAAVADGWMMTAVYKSEPAESYAHISKDGFIGHVCARVTSEMAKRFPHHQSKWKYEAQISLWGPDGLCITPPQSYDWSVIQAGYRMCHACGAKDVETMRYAFAGRCCAACLPAMRAKHETKGWCD